jgi:hypothetical protein
MWGVIDETNSTSLIEFCTDGSKLNAVVELIFYVVTSKTLNQEDVMDWR